MRYLPLYALFFLFAGKVSGQDRQYIDSLLKEARSAKAADTTRIYAYYDISWSFFNLPDSETFYNQKATSEVDACLRKQKKGSKEYKLLELIGAKVKNQEAWQKFLKGNIKEALAIYESSLAVCDRFKGETDPFLREKVNRLLGLTYLNMGPSYGTSGDYKKAELAYLNAIKVFEQIPDSGSLATCYTNLAIDYSLQGLNPTALEYHYKALTIIEKSGKRSGMVYPLINIANIHKKQKDFGKALELYFQALEINKETANKRVEANLYGNIGSIYNDQKAYKKALEYNEKALALNTEIQNRFGQAINCNSIANIYNSQENPEKAIEYFNKALELHLAIGNKDGQAVAFYNLGQVNLSLKKYRESEAFLSKALALAEEINSLENQSEIHKLMSQLFDATGKSPIAYMHYRKFIQLRDSVRSEENAREETRIELSHEFEKQKAIAKVEQDKKDAVSMEEKRIQRFVIIGISIGLLLAIILVVVILKSLRDNQKKNRIIREQKEAVEAQKHLIEEKHKEITDSINYAERIQRSFLATTDLLQTNLHDYFVVFLPKDVVSGDFYWAARLSNGSFAYVTADSTGHGVPGAIMSILNISSLEKAIETETQPAAILNKTREIIIDRLKKDGSSEGGKDGMDCSLILLDPQHTRFSYAAANNPVWLVREGELLEYKGDKMPVGKHDKDQVSFSEQTVALQPGDIIYTLTDGMPDQFGGEKGKKYMHKRLKEFLVSISSLPMQEQKNAIQQEFNSWKKNTGQIDDVTLIGVRIN